MTCKCSEKASFFQIPSFSVENIPLMLLGNSYRPTRVIAFFNMHSSWINLMPPLPSGKLDFLKFGANEFLVCYVNCLKHGESFCLSLEPQKGVNECFHLYRL